MVNSIIERLIEATGADAALIRIWGRNTGKYPVIGHRGYTDDFIEGLRPERADRAIQWVIKHGESKRCSPFPTAREKWHIKEESTIGPHATTR